MDWKKLALRAVLKKAEELYKKDNTIEQITDKLWRTERVAAGLKVLGVSPEELTKMIKDKVGEK